MKTVKDQTQKKTQAVASLTVLGPPGTGGSWVPQAPPCRMLRCARQIRCPGGRCGRRLPCEETQTDGLLEVFVVLILLLHWLGCWGLGRPWWPIQGCARAG